MKIINPLYDNAFKYLMDNEQIAKKVLSIILDQQVMSLQSKPQETGVFTNQHNSTARYDFKAVIRNSNNEDLSVLIELQKYKAPNPIVRFREYLAENYKKEETIIDPQGQEAKQSLPIITIYILGYKVTKAEILALRVERTLKDIIWDEPVNEKPEFVELLTHTSLILQVGSKPLKFRNTRLEKFISLFSQKLKNELPNYVIDVELDKESQADKEITDIVHYLNNATLDEKIVRSLKYEESFEQGLKAVEQELVDTKKIAEKERQEKEQERAEKERAEAQRELAEQKAQAAEQTIISMVKQLNVLKMPIDQIAMMTGKTEQEIIKMLAQAQ